MKRPLSVTLIACVFILAGVSGIIYHATELTKLLSNPEVILVLVVRLLAIVAGVFILRGANWARWLASVWIVYHVVLSFSHSTAELIMHFVIMLLVVVALFTRAATVFFAKA
jgi:hypothetical protein